MNDGGVTTYTTKGDNNNAKDLFSAEKIAVRGKVIFTLPFVGYAVIFFQSRIGIMLLIIIPVGYFIGREVVKIKKELNKRKGGEEIK
ncbi:MAG TPA: hypothetical protein EYP03_01145 [Aquificae bacterium]|nr:hypothetical protein [Aquificota bacterium]